MRLRSSGSWVGLALVAAIAAAASSGCGADDFVPPPELQGAVGEAPDPAGKPLAPAAAPLPVPTAGVRGIELILSGHLDPEEAEIEKAAARSQAGLDKASLRITVPGEDRSAAPGGPASPPKDQAALVRAAVARHAHALVIEPADPADRELARAVWEAREAKVPVILLGRPLAAGPEAKPASPPPAPEVLVAPPSFADSARQLVAAAIRNARNAKLQPEGGALLLINTAADAFVPDRVAALRQALQAAGITSIEEIRFAKDFQAAHQLLTRRLQADAKPVLVFAVDSQATQATNQAASEIVQERPFIQAGYTSDENLTRLVAVGEFAALAAFAPNRMIRKAISTAVAAAQGREVPGRVEISVVTQVSPEKSGAPSLQARYRAQRKSAATRGE